MFIWIRLIANRKARSFFLSNMAIIWKSWTGNGFAQNIWDLTITAASRRAAGSQTVKVKAETNPVPKTQPLLDHVQLHWATPKNDPKTWRGRKTRIKEKKTRGAPNFFSPLSAKNCLPVLTFFASSAREKKTPKHKVRNVKLPACVFQPDSRTPFKSMQYSAMVREHGLLLFYNVVIKARCDICNTCPVLATTVKRGEAGYLPQTTTVGPKL